MTTTKRPPTIVKLLDEPERFDAIKTGYKSVAGLKDFEVKQYKTWHKMWGVATPQSNILWVADLKDEIKAHYEDSSFKDSTKRIHLESLARVLLAIDKVKYRDFARPIYLKTIAMQMAKDVEQEDQELTEKDRKNLVCFEELEAARDELYLKWQSKKKDLALHNKWLILALNTLLPPLRMDYVDMEIYVGKKEPPENETNYMWKKGEQFLIVMNDDKIESKREKRGLSREIFDMPTNSYMNGDLMMAMLHESLEAFPRQYLLLASKNVGEPLSRNSYYSHIKSAIGQAGKAPKQNLLRKIYINEMHLLHQPRLTLAQKKEIARRMRHTLATAQLNYEKLEVAELCRRKGKQVDKPQKSVVKGTPLKKKQMPELIPLLNSDDEEVDEGEAHPAWVLEAPKPKQVANPKPTGAQFDLKLWSKNYYESNKETIKQKRSTRFEGEKHNILRAKILRNLNNGTVARPLKATKEKYSLIHDEATNEWR